MFKYLFICMAVTITCKGMYKFPDIESVPIGRKGTLMHWAASKGHVGILKTLVEREQCDVNVQSPSLLRPIDFAADVPTIQYLIGAGAHVTDITLEHACNRNAFDVIKFLIQQYGRTFTTLDATWNTVLDSQDTELSALLLKEVLPDCYQVRDAVRKGQLAMVRQFKAAGIDISKASDDAGQTSFAAYAYVNKDLEMLKEVIETVDESVFEEVCYEAWAPGLALLVKSDFKPSKELLHAVLLNVIQMDATDCVNLMLKYPVKVELIHLTIAALNENSSIMGALKLQCDSFEQEDLLLSAVGSCNHSVLKSLVTRQSSNVRNERGMTVLHMLVDLASQYLFTEHAHVNRQHLERERLDSLAWLKERKNDILRGSAAGKLFSSDCHMQHLLLTLQALLLTRVTQNEDYQKKHIHQMLTATYAKSYDKKRAKPEALTPFLMAKKRGLAHEFVDLLDPDKCEQWHGGVQMRYVLEQ